MKNLLDITIKGSPIAKGRARVTRHGAYTPKKTKDNSAYIRLVVASVLEMDEPSTMPIEIKMEFSFEPPRSASAKKREQLLTIGYHCIKPDVDNLVKQIYDALNGLVWADDKQICRSIEIKHYGERAYARIIVNELEDGDYGATDV